VLIFHKLALTDAVYAFNEFVLTFRANRLTFRLAEVSSKLFNLFVADPVNVFSDPELAFNESIAPVVASVISVVSKPIFKLPTDVFIYGSPNGNDPDCCECVPRLNLSAI